MGRPRRQSPPLETMRIPRDLARSIKKSAIDHGMSYGERLTQIVELGLERLVELELLTERSTPKGAHHA